MFQRRGQNWSDYICCSREELEKQRATAHYQKLHAEGKTEEARADLARLAIIKQQRADAAKRREDEKKGVFILIPLSFYILETMKSVPDAGRDLDLTNPGNEEKKGVLLLIYFKDFIFSLKQWKVHETMFLMLVVTWTVVLGLVT